MGEVKAILFDVFGSVVDWRGSIIRDLSAWGSAQGLQADWATLADDWRGKYRDSMNRVRSGKLPWMNLENLNAITLDEILPRSLANLGPDQKHHINMVWRRLDPWPDAVPGLTRLKSRYRIATLSNGNVALLAAMAEHARLPWDMIFSAEQFRHYKPDPETYLGAAKLMDLAPGEIMMAAAHVSDLEAAKACGLRTAFFPRPLEFGVAREQSGGDFDILAKDIEDLAAQMGC
jgi:2-haloacid dehalogenase